MMPNKLWALGSGESGPGKFSSSFFFWGEISVVQLFWTCYFGTENFSFKYYLNYIVVYCSSCMSLCLISGELVMTAKFIFYYIESAVLFYRGRLFNPVKSIKFV